MCDPTGSAIRSNSFVCGDAARKHLNPSRLPFGELDEDGEIVRVKVAYRLHEIAEMGLCAADFEDLEDVSKGGLQN